jgi:hypothetical protein
VVSGVDFPNETMVKICVWHCVVADLVLGRKFIERAKKWSSKELPKTNQYMFFGSLCSGLGYAE